MGYLKSGRDWLVLVVCIAIPMLVGGVSGYLTSDDTSGSWYAGLVKPAFQPPGWVFGPVWTTLYALMGIGLFLVWRSPASGARRTALVVFGVQLVLNFFWSLIFFQWKLIGAAAVEIVVLWLAIVGMIVAFMRVHRAAALMQIPYLAWVTFASVLTITIWSLNR